MKLQCECKGRFKEEKKDFEGLECEALVCHNCGYVTLTRKQAEKLLNLKELRDLFRKARKTIRIGNAVGITLPKEFVGRVGGLVTIIPLDDHTLKVSLSAGAH